MNAQFRALDLEEVRKSISKLELQLEASARQFLDALVPIRFDAAA